MTERAERDRLLLFDGACGFCTMAARWVARRLPPGSGVVPWQRAPLDRLGLTSGEAAKTAWWIGADGEAHPGHLAIAEALRAIGGVWGGVGSAIRIPPIRWVAAVVYGLVSRFRGRLPGTAPAVRSEDR